MSSGSPEIKRFRHNVGQNWYHVVITTKYRYPVFAQDHQRKLVIEGIMLVCARHGIDLFTLEVMPDHVHLFVSCPPDRTIRKLVQLIKGGSSYFVRSNHTFLRKYKALWSRGCMYRSVGNVSAKIVKRYIEFSNKPKQKKLF